MIGVNMLRPRIRLVGAACLAGVFLAGCGSSTVPPTTGTAKQGRAKDTSRVSGHERSTNPNVATVTFHVKDMGKRLNLM